MYLKAICQAPAVERLAKTFLKASPQQKDTIRAAFLAVYRPDDIKQFLVADAPAIEELRGMIAVDAETQTDDKVQALQYRFFLENLDGILNKLKLISVEIVLIPFFLLNVFLAVILSAKIRSSGILFPNVPKRLSRLSVDYPVL